MSVTCFTPFTPSIVPIVPVMPSTSGVIEPVVMAGQVDAHAPLHVLTPEPAVSLSKT